MSDGIGNWTNQDPRLTSANRAVRYTRPLLAVLAVVAFAGCNTASQDTVSSTPQTVTSSAPQASQEKGASPEKTGPINDAVQTAAESLAARIIADYQAAQQNNVKHFESEGDGKNVILNVWPNAGSAIGGAFGQYILITGVEKDHKGRLDPKSVNSISIAMNVSLSGSNDLLNSANMENLYSLAFTKNNQSGDWFIEQYQTTARGLAPTRVNYAPNSLNSTSDPMDVGLAELLGRQASDVLTDAENHTPVSFLAKIIR